MIKVKAWLRLMKRKWTKPSNLAFSSCGSDDEITDFDHRPFVAWMNEDKGRIV